MCLAEQSRSVSAQNRTACSPLCLFPALNQTHAGAGELAFGQKMRCDVGGASILGCVAVPFCILMWIPQRQNKQKTPNKTNTNTPDPLQKPRIEGGKRLNTYNFLTLSFCPCNFLISAFQMLILPCPPQWSY